MPVYPGAPSDRIRTDARLVYNVLNWRGVQRPRLSFFDPSPGGIQGRIVARFGQNTGIANRWRSRRQGRSWLRVRFAFLQISARETARPARRELRQWFPGAP